MPFLSRFDIMHASKGTIHLYYMGGGAFPAQEHGFIFSIPVAATVDLMVSRIGKEKRFPSNGYGAIGPIRGTIKLTVAPAGIEKISNA